VLIEDASRFARELITQELGILSLIKRGVRVLTAAGDDLTATARSRRPCARLQVRSLSWRRPVQASAHATTTLRILMDDWRPIRSRNRVCALKDRGNPRFLAWTKLA
jgi:hypothetical protein